MKMNNIIKKTALAITFTGLFSITASAQDQGKSEATIVMSYSKNADLSKTATAIIKVKNKDGKFVAAKNAKVNFYLMHDKQEQLLKSANTDNTGLAVIVLQKDMPLDDSLSFTIVAKVENDPLYENASEQMHYKDANLSIKLNPADTGRVVIAKVTQTGKDGKEIAIKGTEVKFYVKRLFGNMPAAEEYAVSTEDNGEASFIIPKNIPGDLEGKVTVVAKIEDNDKFGNVEGNADTKWGKPLATIKDPFPRELWSPYAPLPLVITISTLFGGVWFTYFFLFYQLVKIKKDTAKA